MMLVHQCAKNQDVDNSVGLMKREKKLKKYKYTGKQTKWSKRKRHKKSSSIICQGTIRFIVPKSTKYFVQE